MGLGKRVFGSGTWLGLVIWGWGMPVNSSRSKPIDHVLGILSDKMQRNIAMRSGSPWDLVVRNDEMELHVQKAQRVGFMHSRVGLDAVAKQTRKTRPDWLLCRWVRCRSAVQPPPLRPGYSAANVWRKGRRTICVWAHRQLDIASQDRHYRNKLG